MKNLGVVLLIIGFVFIGIAMFDFFTLETWEEPKYFWMFFVALPLIFIGFVLNRPRIQKAMLEQQKDTIRETMKVMGEGLNAGINPVEKYCSNCGNGAPKEDKYCSKCGTAL
jgi:hypothetical protein